MVMVENKIKSIKDVLCVPGLKHNLLSIGKIADANMFVTFHKHGCLIYDKDDQIVARGLRDNGLYKFEGIIAKEHACLVDTRSKNHLWHERYNHLNFFYLGLLNKNNLVDGIPEI